jgi:hypothetical protein
MSTGRGTSALTGIVVDQAQLLGFIERLEELALELESVEQIGSRRVPGARGDERGET